MDLDELWARFDSLEAADFRARMDEVAAGLPAAVAAYERGSAFDATDDPGRAVPLYREALALGLGEDRRRQCVIQLASSLRNLGEAQEAVSLLREERSAGSDADDDAVAAFLALALADTGREREALAVALLALSGHMDRYRRSLEAYVREL